MQIFREMHDKNLTEILQNSRINHGSEIVVKEAQFYRDSILIAEPDGIIVNEEGITIFEYKRGIARAKKANEQLSRARRFIENDFGFYVPGTNIIFVYN